MKSISYLFIILILVSCTAKKPQPRKLEISFGNLMSEDFLGGIAVKAVSTSGVVIEKNLTAAPFVLPLDYGTWDFYIVAYMGPSALTGTTLCGSALAAAIAAADASVNIVTDNTNCSSAPYVSIIAANTPPVAGEWDELWATWDNPSVVWGP